MSSSSAQGGQLESMLGDLQSDLSKQGVTTKTKGLCAACNQPVVGQVNETDKFHIKMKFYKKIIIVEI